MASTPEPSSQFDISEHVSLCFPPFVSVSPCFRVRECVCVCEKSNLIVYVYICACIFLSHRKRINWSGKWSATSCSKPSKIRVARSKGKIWLSWLQVKAISRGICPHLLSRRRNPNSPRFLGMKWENFSELDLRLRWIRAVFLSHTSVSLLFVYFLYFALLVENMLICK